MTFSEVELSKRLRLPKKSEMGVLRHSEKKKKQKQGLTRRPGLRDTAEPTGRRAPPRGLCGGLSPRFRHGATGSAPITRHVACYNNKKGDNCQTAINDNCARKCSIHQAQGRKSAPAARWGGEGQNKLKMMSNYLYRWRFSGGVRSGSAKTPGGG